MAPRKRSTNQLPTRRSERIGALLSADDGKHAKKIKKILNDANDLLNDEVVAKLDIVEETVDALTTAIMLTETVDKLRVQGGPAKWNVEGISFSRVKKADYGRLGLTEICVEIDSVELKTLLKDFMTTVNEDGAYNKSVPRLHSIARTFCCGSEVVNSVIKYLEVIGISFGPAPEARARLIIDQIFLGLLIALGENHVKSFVFLEMRIASKGEIIEIHHDAYKTILTGSVDYAVLTVIPDESTPGDNKADPTSDDEEEGDSGLSDILKNHFWRNLIDGEGLQIFLVEAKKKALARNLTKHIPQVAAETLATMKLTKRESMQWCLTTGTTWIFGIVVRVQEYREDEVGYKNHANVYTLSPRHLSLSKTKVEKTIEEISWLLMCWSICDPEELLHTFFKGSR